jgi:GR25 family glycosyltransferase involved in LPS biosynthesis
MDSYRGFYINLDYSIDRLIYVQHNLRKIGISKKYKRFDAIKADAMTHIHSKLTKEELACMQSHINIIKENQYLDKHIHIIEDDVNIHLKNDEIVEYFINNCDEWDILFTGLQVPLFKQQIDFLINLYNKENGKSIQFFDMKNFFFVGAFSYVINKNSINKILKIYEDVDYQRPIDFLFRDNILEQKNLKAFCTFPLLVQHSGYFDTTMKDRSFELTYKYQYLFQKAFIFETSLNSVFEEIQQYAIDIDYHIDDNTINIKNIYDILLDMGQYILSTNIHGKYRK